MFVRLRVLLLIGLTGAGIYLWNKGDANFTDPRTESQLVEILSHSELAPAFEKVVAESHRSHSETGSENDRQQSDGGGGVASVSPFEFQRSKVERELDSVPISSFEVPILQAFGSSHSGTLLRRIVVSRRYPGQVQGAEKLEDITLQELGQDPENAARVMADVLRTLSKSEYREEHVTLWDLSNRIPGVHSRLQDLSPDEEFL